MREALDVADLCEALDDIDDGVVASNLLLLVSVRSNDLEHHRNVGRCAMAWESDSDEDPIGGLNVQTKVSKSAKMTPGHLFEYIISLKGF